ncbi:HlyD family efflux transporter periplasmic adaptor subunit [Carboxydothermus hydrogenoformans]|uniref:Membrane fusion protein n=1 Tax=Carboxydothermus hydrogenoformans (strain ATCC BAA-161 / DSM 6008 / Z-2901) TaxID=246194 RepID=Q3AAH1_CARHZ|nr:HlyD family efflux transporter periplasmic adaptor subunit [Carboxydothermus hydrogenoformans]ABB15264.1 hypothetical protein CHY_2044 [Carboxydothermus hydrogenoformans Z-2901]
MNNAKVVFLKKKRKKKKRNKKVLIYFLMGSFVAFILLNFGKTLLVQNFNPVGYLEWKVFEDGVRTEGFLFKNEVPVYAEANGKVELLLAWKKVRKGDTIVKIKDNASQKIIPVKAKVNGIFVPNTDGLEFIGPDNIETLNPSKILELYQPRKVEGDAVEGQPLGKIIDNLNPILLVIPKLSLRDNLVEGREYRLNINEKYELKANFLRKNGEVALFSINFYPDELLNQRKVSVFIKTKEYSGFWVPVSAVKQIAGKTYIYTLKNEEVVLTPVKVVLSRENNVLVEGEKESKDELIGKKYLIRPFLVQPGDKFH